MKLTKIESYEIQAFAFRVMTGYMAPGKDVSPLACEAPYEERCAAWDEWRNKHAHCILAMLHGFEALIDRDDEPTRALLDRLDAAEREAALRAEVEALKADLSTYMQAANEHLADAEALRKLQAGEAYKAADYLRALADAQPVAWIAHNLTTGHVKWTTDRCRARGWTRSVNLRVKPLYAHPAPAAPQAEPIDPHMIVADDRFPDEQAEPKRDQPLLDLLAVIHCDGGHHTEAVGIEQSIKDAQVAVSELKNSLATGDNDATRTVEREPLSDWRIGELYRQWLAESETTTIADLMRSVERAHEIGGSDAE